MDFSKMTGYEFEDYIAALLRSKGFSVSQTSYSGDGGVDLVATYDKPLLSGKYIVQCKNYAGLVGQPEIRDLYGVVMSESANKGILITPSDFTAQAYAFAKGKNLELINRAILLELIGENSTASIEAKKQFYEYEGFNRSRFNYLKSKIEDDPSNEKYYEEQYDFLYQYVRENQFEICKNGLFSEMLTLLQNWKSRCYKAKSKDVERKRCDLLTAIFC